MHSFLTYDCPIWVFARNIKRKYLYSTHNKNQRIIKNGNRYLRNSTVPRYLCTTSLSKKELTKRKKSLKISIVWHKYRFTRLQSLRPCQQNTRQRCVNCWRWNLSCFSLFLVNIYFCLLSFLFTIKFVRCQCLSLVAFLSAQELLESIHFL